MGGDMMSYRIKVSKNLSRDKISENSNEGFEDIISRGKSIDLRNNSRTIVLQNGYEKIVSIDKLKFFKSN